MFGMRRFSRRLVHSKLKFDHKQEIISGLIVSIKSCPLKMYLDISTLHTLIDFFYVRVRKDLWRNRLMRSNTVPVSSVSAMPL